MKKILLILVIFSHQILSSFTLFFPTPPDSIRDGHDYFFYDGSINLFRDEKWRTNPVTGGSIITQRYGYRDGTNNFNIFETITDALGTKSKHFLNILNPNIFQLLENRVQPRTHNINCDENVNSMINNKLSKYKSKSKLNTETSIIPKFSLDGTALTGTTSRPLRLKPIEKSTDINTTPLPSVIINNYDYPSFYTKPLSPVLSTPVTTDIVDVDDSLTKHLNEYIPFVKYELVQSNPQHLKYPSNDDEFEKIDLHIITYENDEQTSDYFQRTTPEQMTIKELIDQTNRYSELPILNSTPGSIAFRLDSPNVKLTSTTTNAKLSRKISTPPVVTTMAKKPSTFDPGFVFEDDEIFKTTTSKGDILINTLTDGLPTNETPTIKTPTIIGIPTADEESTEIDNLGNRIDINVLKTLAG